MTIKYKPGGVTVTIGQSQDVSLPPRVFRGRATCMHFDTDKSFLLPPSIDGVRNIVAFYNRHPGMTMLVNGHTDAQGGAAYNLPLSNERSQSVAAYLQDDVDAWMAWYQNPQPSKCWGAHEDELMRQKLRDEGQTPPDDRRALVTAYMGLQGTSLPQGSPSIVTHGCGLFHLAVPTQDACEENRRVEIFLFDGPVNPAPQDPCPSPGCTQYLQWVANPDEDIDLCAPQKFNLRVVVQNDAAPPQPIAGAQVSVSPGGFASETADDFGVAMFLDVPAGTYDVTASHDGFPSKTQSVTVPGPDSTDDAAAATPAASSNAFADGNDQAQPSNSPPPPPPNTTTAQVTLAATKIDLTVDWGTRSKVSKLIDEAVPLSFWLTNTPSPGPAKLGLVAPASASTWFSPSATVTNIPLTLGKPAITAKTTTSVTNGDLLRFDFELTATVSGTTKTILKFSQLLKADASGLLTATKYVIDRATFTKGASGTSAPTRAASAVVELTGTHPLLDVSASTPQTLTVNAEFVDVTDLWWTVHAPGDKWGWYLNPALAGRVANLRVLAWTTGAPPMLWFACAPDAALSTVSKSSGATREPADLIFMRPQAAPANSVRYTPDAAGFAQTSHENTTTFILSRYLLSPVAPSSLAALTAAGVMSASMLIEPVPPSTATGPPPVPADPMTDMSGTGGSFRPVGLEAALNAAGEAHVLYLPLGYDGNKAHPGGGYTGLQQLGGLKKSMASAFVTLWNIGAVGTLLTAAPDPSTRELWLAGHSGGNPPVTDCVAANAADVARVISISFESPIKKLITAGISNFASAATTRGAKGFEVFIISAPDLKSKQDKTKLPKIDYEAITAADVAPAVTAGATVVLLPDTATEATYWQISPVDGMTPFMRNLLANWDVTAGGVNLIEQSATAPTNWFFLFFHEYAAFGGHLGPSGELRTFFSEALLTTTFGSVNVSVIEAFGAGKAVPNARVTAHGPITRVAFADGNGRLTLSNLVPGSYTIEAEAFELGPNSVTATIAAGAGNGAVTVKLIFNPSTI